MTVLAKTLLAILIAINTLPGKELDSGSPSAEFRVMDLRSNPIDLPKNAYLSSSLE